MIFRNENAVERRGGPFLDIFFPRNVPPRWWSSATKTGRNAQKSSVTAQLRLFVVYSFYFNLCLELYQHGHQRCSDSHQAVRLTCPLWWVLGAQRPDLPFFLFPTLPLLRFLVGKLSLIC
jgi:hypothetical protein